MFLWRQEKKQLFGLFGRLSVSEVMEIPLRGFSTMTYDYDNDYAGLLAISN